MFKQRFFSALGYRFNFYKTVQNKEPKYTLRQGNKILRQFFIGIKNSRSREE